MSLSDKAKEHLNVAVANDLYGDEIADAIDVIDNKLDANTAITGATKTKITYDADGLVTAGDDATTADIADSTDKRYCTDAEKVVIGNTSGINTGDEDLTSIKTKLGAAATAADGYLTSADWNAFNGKQSALTMGQETTNASGEIAIVGMTATGKVIVTAAESITAEGIGYVIADTDKITIYDAAGAAVNAKAFNYIVIALS